MELKLKHNADLISNKICRTDLDHMSQLRDRLPEITETIINNCYEKECYKHIDTEPLASEGFVDDLIHKFREVIFPGYFTKEKLNPVNLRYSIGTTVSVLYEMLAEQVAHYMRHDCLRYETPSCRECEELGHEIALSVLDKIPQIRTMMSKDVQAAYDGDPAAKSYDEIIFSYPGIYAMTVYRIAHILYELNIPLLPRILTEQAHSVTGIDIHPGATINESFAIDHGTGVVIGETTEIGQNVRVYQGVTLGALSLPKGAGDRYRGKKRHPTIEDDVIIYAGATILGGDTRIGARSIIGGNVWLTDSVPPDTKVLIEKPKLVFK